MNLTASDYIAAVAVLVAFLSAYYARQARDAARRAKTISVHEGRRPLRLAVYQSMMQFATYCSQYVTMHHLNVVHGTRELTGRIGSFDTELLMHGELHMPDVAERAKTYANNAWNMQRLLDRLAGGQNTPLDASYPTAQDHLDALADWFGLQAQELPALFRPYLAEAQP